MSDELELVTFGHGAKRCIGEKMARAMMIAFLVEVTMGVCVCMCMYIYVYIYRPRGQALHRQEDG